MERDGRPPVELNNSQVFGAQQPHEMQPVVIHNYLPEQQASMAAAKQDQAGREKSRGGLINTIIGHKKASLAIGGTAALASALLAGGILGKGLHNTTTVDVHSAPPEVTAITGEDIGCFVEVDANVHIWANMHHSISFLHYGTKSVDLYAKGDSELCVNNDDIQVIPEPATTDGTPRILNIILAKNALTIHRPRVTASDTKVGSNKIIDETTLLGAKDKTPQVQDELFKLAASEIGSATCANEAYQVAETKLAAHFDKIAHTFGYAKAVESYSGVPVQQQNLPVGDITNLAKQKGWTFHNSEVKAEGQSCSATLIDGSPVVTGAPTSSPSALASSNTNLHAAKQ